VLVLEYFDWLWCNSNIFLRSLFYFCCEFDIFRSLLFGAVQLNLSPITHIQTYLFFSFPRNVLLMDVFMDLFFNRL
jgi:hypothetical protein